MRRSQVLLPIGILLVGAVAAVAPTPPVPAFAVDKLWPMPLPNHWILGSITGVAVDRRDHIWIAHRAASLNARTEAGLTTTPPTAEECCLPAPPILELDASGKLIATWGGPGQGYDWPISTGAIVVDDKDNIWITAAGVPEPAAVAAGATGVVPGAGRGGNRGGGAATPPAEPPADAQILEFGPDRNFVRQFGKPGQTSADDPANLDHPADVAVDTKANELYVADGGAHQRVVVLDATTGAFKRQWAGHGAAFARVSAIVLSKDGMVYVGDRKGNRIQVFKKNGTFVSETTIAPNTLANGSVWDVALSSDAAQQYLIVADGQNEQIDILNRKTLKPVSTFGDGGRWPGRFYAVDAVAVDTHGNIYTGEGYEGKRVQKFLKQ